MKFHFVGDFCDLRLDIVIINGRTYNQVPLFKVHCITKLLYHFIAVRHGKIIILIVSAIFCDAHQFIDNQHS
ncbi:hypothetical protein D3C86_1430100 [compost metagenome]